MAKKKGGSAGWLATFADMMSLLMAFFVMLYAMSEVEVDKYEAVTQSLTETFSHGQDTTQTQRQHFQQTQTQPTPNENTGTAEKNILEDLKPLYDSLIETFAKELAQTKLNIQLEENGQRLRITFPNEVAFPSGQAIITDAFWRLLYKLPSWQNQPVQVKVIGHTDSRPIFNEKFLNNWELSAIRAATVVDELTQIEKIHPHQAMAIGLADTQPLDPRQTPEAYRKNRRVEILIEPSTTEKSEQDKK